MTRREVLDAYLRDRAVGLGYHDKGWPSFEYRLAMMIKVSNDSRFKDWPQVLDLGKQGDAPWEMSPVVC